MAFNAGQLRHRVELQRQQYEQDSAGDPIQDPVSGELRMEWVTYASAWASIEPLSAREFIASGASVSEMSARLTMRWGFGFLASDRVKHEAKVYNPRGVLADVDSGREYFTMPCSEGVSDEGL